MELDLGFFELNLGLVVAGLVVGFVVGLTGMGGGALMTPVLILFFGIDPLSAVSSDLVVSLLMKPVGAAVHIRRGTVNYGLVRWLMVGSVPAAFGGVLILKALGDAETVQHAIKVALGIALLLSVATMLSKALISLRQYYRELDQGILGPSGNTLFGITIKPIPTLLVGIIGGAVVGMTSVGSGSLIIVGLLLLYPTLRAGDLVGTDLVQAVPLVGAAALGHILFGDFSAATTASLLVGALPGVYVGARVSAQGQGGLIRRALILVLLASGLKLVGVGPTGIVVALVSFVVLGPVAWALVRNTHGLRRPPAPVEGVPWWRLVWAAATGVPPRYQRAGRPAQEAAAEWEPERSAIDPL